MPARVGVALVAACMIGAPAAEAAKKPTVLIVTASQGKRASLAKVAEKRLVGAVRNEGLRPVVARSKREVTTRALRRASAVVFATNRGTVLTDALEDTLNARVRAGMGVVLVGSAVRMQPGSQDFVTLVGGEPTGVDAAKQAEVEIVDRIHASTAQLPRRWYPTEQWVSLKKSITGRVHVLAWVDEKTYTPGEGMAMGVEHPVTWCRQLGEGTSWTTTMGLDRRIWNSTVFRKQLRGAIAAAAGYKSAGDCGATVWSNWKRTVIDEDITDGTQLKVGPDGRVYYLERTLSTLKVFDPVADIVKDIAFIPSIPGLGQGLLGLAIDPNFKKTRWLYLYYHLEGLTARLSRFTLTKDDQLDVLSEKVLLRIDNTSIDHNGGGLEMRSNGDLYIAIGSNDMPHFDGLYGSRNRTLPGEAGQLLEINGEMTSANTLSLLGKVLRIHPRPDGTYTIPKGNMFAPGTPKTRPEIFSMGHRNAFHVQVDDITGDLLEGDVGPDGREDSPEFGSMGYDEFNLIREDAGNNFGYPYCVGPNKPFVDRDVVTGQSRGVLFDCNNLSAPQSPGLKDLPPGKVPLIWYPYGVGTDFPEMSETWAGGTDGGRLAIPGPKYRAFDGSRMPLFYDGSWFIADWTRNWIKQVILDEEGKVLRIQRFAPDRGVQAPIDMELGADGSMYVLEWGGQTLPFGNPLAAKLTRYQYVPKCGTCDPTVVAGGAALPGVGVAGNVIAGPLAQTAGFLTTSVSLAKGSNLTFTNLDVVPHNVASKTVLEDGRRLFASSNIATGTAVVEGAERLDAGTYDFLCTVHPSMVGTLEVG